jgi:L-iditol 2-dehydrogenase
MKALVYTGPETLDYRDVPDAAPKEGEDLIRVESVGICGSDMHAYLGHDERRPAPLILGHEVAGVIVGGPRDGQRVTINPLVTCGACRACQTGQDNLCPERQIISMPPREGAFAERVAMPEGNLVPVPDDVPLSKAALAEPIACGWHTVRLSLAVLGGAERALVLGGGAIGVGAALSLKAQGVNDVLIVEPNTPRRRFLELRCGLPALPPDRAPEAAYDIVIDGVGFEATRAQASALVRPGGVIGIRRMTLQEITFIGTYTYTAQDFRDTAQAIFEGCLGPLDWTERRALAEGAKGFADIRAGRVASPKIILTP